MEPAKIQVTCNPFGSSWVHERFKTVKKPSQEYQMKRMSFSASILAIASIFAYGEKHSVPYDREIRLSSSYRPSRKMFRKPGTGYLRTQSSREAQYAAVLAADAKRARKAAKFSNDMATCLLHNPCLKKG